MKSILKPGMILEDLPFPCIIFSAEDPRDTNQINAFYRERALGFLLANGIPFKDLRGSSDGAFSGSFFAVPDTEKNRRRILEKAFGGFGKESVLIVNASKQAHVIHDDDRIEPAGSMREASKSEAASCDACMTDGDRFWVCD